MIEKYLKFKMIMEIGSNILGFLIILIIFLYFYFKFFRKKK